MAFAVRAFFTALKRYADEHSNLLERLHIHFIGTDYAPKDRARKTIEPLARECGVDNLVTEQTDRLPYFATLRCLSDADALFSPGSDDPGYTASKLYPYILAKKPLLAVFHQASSVVEVLRTTKAGRVVTFGNGRDLTEVANEIYKQWFACWPLPAPATDWNAFAPYTAREMTRRLCEAFDRAARPKGD
jgi:broad specificity phosphatase PhoE